MVQIIPLLRQRRSAESSECSNIFLADLPEFIERPALRELHRPAPISQKLLVHMSFVKAHLRQCNLLLMQRGPNMSIERKQPCGMLLHRSRFAIQSRDQPSPNLRCQASAARSTVASSPTFPSSIVPIGSPSDFPQRTLIAGWPVKSNWGFW
jgi:hypothetical protein